MRFILNSLDYPNKDRKVVTPPDPMIVGSAKNIYERGDHYLESSPLEEDKKED
jgi:hypothetical protein